MSVSSKMLLLLRPPKINSRLCGAPESADCNIRRLLPVARDSRMESAPLAHVRTSADDDVDAARSRRDAALLCPSRLRSAAREFGRVRPRSWDLGRSGSISQLGEPLDRAADEDGVSAHSRNDPSRGRRGTLSPSTTSAALADLSSPHWRRLSLLERRAPGRRRSRFVRRSRVIGLAGVRGHVAHFAHVLPGAAPDARPSLRPPRRSVLFPA